MLLLPELAITGYPPEDLLLREALWRITSRPRGNGAAAGRTVTVVGFVDRVDQATTKTTP